jgi:transcription factor SPN1
LELLCSLFVYFIFYSKHLHDSILDNGLLDTIRIWLEPLPDRSLPSMDIQSEMLDVLDRLPIAGDHLRESGVGKIVYFYTKSPRIEPIMKRKADQLVAKWSRLVIKRSENYKERRHAVQEFRHEDM